MSKARKKKLPQIPLNQCHLFRILSIHALAKRIGWELDTLNKIAKDGSYRIFKHRETGRQIQEPGPLLQNLHRQLHRYLSRVQTPEYLHSAVKGRSYLTNARAHIGCDNLIKIDIAKFYQSVSQHKVMHFFRDTMQCAPDVAGLLANLICFNGMLATGSSISPIISYFSYKKLFDDIHNIALRENLVMTCYVDDITLSGKNASGKTLHKVRTTIFQYGLRAHKDSQFSEGNPKLVTGVIVGKEDIALPFSRWKKIHLQIREIEGCSDIEQKLRLYPKLLSRLHEAMQIDPKCTALAKKHLTDFRLLKRRGVVKTLPLPRAA
ncbi:reverse transcriptase family protein [Acetobacter thailandicus]|uniref:reverse transcriptase family protein n=1 Tax=Acetobacter thailandicus TaxID=1502842 RepID=UPI001BA453E6|nr:reverse transcriptase family protein [Acetobacter thailandicus]MBS0986539.1 RNA-directed DNA polymerase [Acetobacter thailandicus]